MTVPSLSFDGKIVVITGGRRGMGRGFALAFAEGGADVAICDNVLEDGELEGVAEEIRKLGRRSLFAQVEVSKKAEVDNFIQRVENELGGIDILVNSAGMIIRKSLMEMNEEEYDTVMDVDLKGYFLCAQAVAKRMMDRQRGTIVQIASRAAFQSALNQGVYPIAKTGVVMLTRILARELAQYKIRVNAIAPGGTRTKFNEAMRLARPEGERGAATGNPLGRMAEVDDMVGPVLFLASDSASGFITGFTILVDGGVMA